MFTCDEILCVASKVEQYAHVLNAPNDNNTIKIKHGKMTLIENGNIIISKQISTKSLGLECVEYSKNVFNSIDNKYSPLEADRKSNWRYWVKKYRNIDFPKLIPIPMIAYLFIDKWPDVIDLGKIYALAYTEIVPSDEMIMNKRVLFTGNYDKFKNVGTLIKYTDGRIVHNRVIRFKEKYLKYVRGFPCNEFTTEQLFNRIYKAYGSCTRDVHMPVRFYEHGANAEYDLYLDMIGIDGLIEGIPYYNYSNTKFGEIFRKIKVSTRHKNLSVDLGIKFVKNNENRNGIYLVDDSILRQTIEQIKDNKITGIVEIKC